MSSDCGTVAAVTRTSTGLHFTCGRATAPPSSVMNTRIGVLTPFAADDAESSALPKGSGLCLPYHMPVTTA